MHNKALGGLIVGLVATAIIGCGARDTDSLRRVPVSGTITLDGKPLGNTEVTFIPTGNTKGRGATGFTTAEGRFELSVSNGRPGVPAGEYRVVLNKLVMPDGSDFPLNSPVPPIESPARELLPACYSNAESTTLTAMVPEGGSTIDFSLSMRGAKLGSGMGNRQ
jgi:hypothetical protein